MINNSPKVFISYCRQPEENLIKTQQLAERLTRNGVYVVIDIWDLKDGQDKNAYMEKMVNDPTVDKVLLICNKQYVQKADKRKGGVGIESTIISAELYESLDQTKFLPVIFETDEQGKAYVPVFAKSRIYIDLSSDDKFEEGYDQLLRDIYDKPKFDRPPLGEMPNYLKVDAPAYLKTAGKVNSLKSAIEKESKRTVAIVEEYIDTFFDSLPDFKISVESSYNAQKLVEVVEEAIDRIQVLKNDFISFLTTIVKTEYCNSELFQDFFERLLQFYEDNDIQLLDGSDLQSYLNDNFRFFNYEVFLSFVTIMINNGRYDVVSDVTRYNFCIISKYRYTSAEARTFRRFQSYIGTLNRVKHDITNSLRISIAADTVKQYTTVLKFEDLVTTDILLYYISLVFPGSGYLDSYWYPDLSVYNRYMELYPRLVSKRFFEKFKCLFNAEDDAAFKNLISSVQEPNIRDGYHRIPPIKQGLCFETVATMN
jgi:hypothetical protein